MAKATLGYKESAEGVIHITKRNSTLDGVVVKNSSYDLWDVLGLVEVVMIIFPKRS